MRQYLEQVEEVVLILLEVVKVVYMVVVEVEAITLMAEETVLLVYAK